MLNTIECSISRSKWDNEVLAYVECNGFKMKPIKAAGPIEADLVYEDDSNDKQYLLRTIKVNVKAWDKSTFQVEPDDVLALAHIAPRPEQTGHSPRIRFWIANRANIKSTLRCTVDGKPIRSIEGTLQANDSVEAVLISGKARNTWTWSLAQFDPIGWYYVGTGAGSDIVYNTDHPGNWDCQLRSNGVTLRELKFTVNKKGDVVSAPLQQAKDAPLLPPRWALIEMKIPKDTGLDKRIKPAALKASRGFGLPWPAHDSVKAIHAALPPAYENVNPVAPKRKSKFIVGLEATPPRFIDESRTVVRLSRQMNGYAFHVDARPVGTGDAASSVYRVDWKQGGKVIASQKCSGSAHLECDYRSDKPLSTKGAHEAQLIQYDDDDGNEYLLRSYKVNVVKFTSVGDAVWPIVPDDLLATAWASQYETTTAFHFWVGHEDISPVLRCTVDGKKLPDITTSTQSSDPSIKAEVRTKKGDTVVYVWHSVGAEVRIAPGPLPKKATKTDDHVAYLAHYPGAWDCSVRHKGKQIRQLLFTVSKDGYIQADPDQPGPTADGVVPIALRFGKDNLDTRVRPDAMKKSRGFGLPWPKPPVAKFPPASGLPDPK